MLILVLLSYCKKQIIIYCRISKLLVIEQWSAIFQSVSIGLALEKCGGIDFLTYSRYVELKLYEILVTV